MGDLEISDASIDRVMSFLDKDNVFHMILANQVDINKKAGIVCTIEQLKEIFEIISNIIMRNIYLHSGHPLIPNLDENSIHFYNSIAKLLSVIERSPEEESISLLLDKLLPLKDPCMSFHSDMVLFLLKAYFSVKIQEYGDLGVLTKIVGINTSSDLIKSIDNQEIVNRKKLYIDALLKINEGIKIITQT